MRRLIALGCLLLAPSPSAALYQGTADLHGRYPAVVAIGTQTEMLCSATKIGARRLLTAAHCVVDAQNGELRPAFEPGREIVVNQAPVQRQPGAGQRVTVARTLLSPEYARGLKAFRAYKAQQLLAAREGDSPGSALPEMTVEASLKLRLRLRYHFAARYPDVALIDLRTETPTIPTLAVRAVAPAPGDEVVLVGYGCAQPGAKTSGPVRRGWGRTQVIRADAINFYSMAGQKQDGAPSLCPGTSGGPVLRQGQVIGVNSVVYGLNARHGARSNMAVNLAPLADWLDSAH
ncbi:trypsin-like serine protease [Thiorhodovibrio frisius]|uniref:V8-like Glu-specific endopeptidase n=1 Tax=Thiorhodovibrio frisius TaxID=631362 RepID=H8Z5L7_9GAMM|nr:trypsin-like serine protease [Thiorhodovibrio frisius]EIC20587.1 V8-like Glu-specific endopeptidase [Thiorhodovibrio frisius]WPL21336.1 V8-like Glu-specific endopeptidase [Thiorhodovibrio frisius]